MSRPVQRVGGRELDQAFLPVEEDERQSDVRISTFSPLNKFRIFLKKLRLFSIFCLTIQWQIWQKVM